VLPEDAWWPVRLGAPDGLVRGDDEVYTEVVEGLLLAVIGAVMVVANLAIGSL
jgi:hypothetical protein